MKKVLRLLAVALSLFIVCFTFCGCDALEELRKTHAVWVDEDKTAISLNGKEYKLLPECEFFNPVCDNIEIRVTESDVPVLLSSTYGEYASLSNDKDFLVSNPYDPIKSYLPDTKNYCSINRYEEIKTRIEDGPIMDGFCYEYSVYDDETYEYSTKIYHLTEDEVTAVLSVLANNETTQMDVYDGYTECCIELFRSSQDALFRKRAFDIVIYSTKAYLVYNAAYEESYLANDNTYVVPDELYPTIRGIADDFIEAIDY